MYTKGEVIIFSHKDEDFMEKFFGDRYLGRTKYGDGFIIKTSIGSENKEGEKIVNTNPDLFDSYDRRELRDESLYETLTKIEELVIKMKDNLGTKFTGNKLKNDINELKRLISKMEK